MRAARWLEDYWPHLATALAGIGFPAVGVLLALSSQGIGLLAFILSVPGAIFVVAMVMILLGTIVSGRRTRAMRPLREKIRNLEGILEQMPGHYYDLCSHELANVLRRTLSYGDTERISVYRHRGKGKGAFQIIGRYSENPEFARLGRRHVYPDDEGVISRAWEQRTAVANLPDPEEEPENYYQTLESEWNISRETAEGFTMKSRSLVACALYEPKGVDRVAIIVVESTKVGILDEERVVQAMDGEDGRRVYVFLEKMQTLEPNFEYAREEGF